MNYLHNFCKTYFERRYINSLLAKPFVILSGNSGTGKTKVACKIAKYYHNNIPDYNKSLKDLFKYILEHDYDMNGVRLKSVSETAVEVYNTKNKYICISFGIIQEYIDWYAQNGIASNPARSDMQEQGLYDGQSYSWDTTHIEKIAKFVLDYENKERKGVYTSNHLLIPVGADWTDNTKILGYFNPLANDGKGEYVKSEILEFIEKASDNPEVPFFLILDEMNLSHVERYFSDFFSAMESGEPILLYKRPEGCECTTPEKITLPKNLFITGTVNIDETTYMFSPKVLDRANVIEFKPEMEDVLDNLLKSSNGDDDKVAEPGVAEGFMQLANEVRSGTIPSEVQPILEGIKLILESFYKELEKCGFEFAYRTVKEIRLYAIAAYKTAEEKKPTATEIADIQILQKVLPKIHGNKKQIGSLLDELEKLCIKKDSIDSSVTPSITGTGYNLPASLFKIRQMKDRLNRFQYASFI